MEDTEDDYLSPRVFVGPREGPMALRKREIRCALLVCLPLGPLRVCCCYFPRSSTFPDATEHEGRIHFPTISAVAFFHCSASNSLKVITYGRPPPCDRQMVVAVRGITQRCSSGLTYNWTGDRGQDRSRIHKRSELSFRGFGIRAPFRHRGG